MTQTNAERQAAFREGMKSKGFVQALVWIPSDKRAEINACAKSLREEASPTPRNP